MSLITRRAKAAQTPEVLQEQLRDAQAEHAQAVAAANAKLYDTHDGVLGYVQNRQATISEQVQLLQAEHDALTPVALAASQPRQATPAGQ